MIDIDEKGNPIEKKEEKKKNNSSKKFYLIIISILLFLLIGLSYLFCNKFKKNKNVFDETTLKNLKLKNRVFFGAISHDPKKIEAVAKNEAALIVTEGCMVGDFYPTPLQNGGPFRVDSDEYLDELKKFPEAVHKYNSFILLDLVHFGLNSAGPSYSPSGDKGVYKDIETKAMTKEDIIRIQDYFVQGAIRAKKAGFDGIEIHGGHLHLVSSFLSQKFNRRTDEYGGSDENRAKFLIEIIKKIREAIGDEMIISAKIDSVNEEMGFTEKGFLTTSKLLEEAGVDLLEVTGVNALQKGDMYFYNDTKKLAETVKVPVTCIGGIKTYKHADYILKNSNIEYIGMSRTLLKDSEIIKKWHNNN